MHFRGQGNYKFVLPALRPFINSIEGKADRNRSVADLILQLRGDETLFWRIVLFSPFGPKSKSDAKNVFVDWITPESPTDIAHPPIDGYFVSPSSILGSLDLQIRRLMALITTGSAIFNVKVAPVNTNYRCLTPTFRYATGMTHFCQSFRLSPIKLGNLAPALFGVEVSYIRFSGPIAFRETVWASRLFRKSADFIPVCASVNPFVLVPHLCEENALERFACELLMWYQQAGLSALAGGQTDVTFSTIPSLQWFLLALCGVPPQFAHTAAPFYCDTKNRFAYYYPRVSYWESPECQIMERAHIAYEFFALLGEPEIAVVDSFMSICVYGLQEVPEGTVLGEFLRECIENRFPQPLVEFGSREELVALLRSNDEILKRVTERVAPRIETG
jgi:hypothetical protein